METTQINTPTTAETRSDARLERVRGLSYEEFIRRYVIPRQPVVLEDVISEWPALQKWTPDFWIKRYNDRRVEIDANPFSLGEVIRLALAPKEDTPPPYYRNIRIGHEYPELQADISPYPVFCRPNWFHSAVFKPLKASFMGYGEYELFIGGAGRSFPYLHFDVPGAHTFIHQLQGRKLLVLFAPSDAPYLYPKTGDFNVSCIPDVDHVSADDFPLFNRATRIDAELGPGDTLFMPFGWWHTARMLSFSVTVGIDVANDTNWENVSGFLAKKAHAKLGPMGMVFMAYVRLAGAYLDRTARVPTRVGI